MGSFDFSQLLSTADYFDAGHYTYFVLFENVLTFDYWALVEIAPNNLDFRELFS